MNAHCRDLDHCAAKVAFKPAQAAFAVERFGDAAHHVGVQRLRRWFPPTQGQVVEFGQHRLLAQVTAVHAGDVGMQQAGIDQFANHHAQPAGGMEMVHVGGAVRIHPRQQRRGLGQLVQVVPVDQQAGSAGHRHQVQGVVGGAAGRGQADHRVDDGLLVDRTCKRPVVIAKRGDP